MTPEERIAALERENAELTKRLDLERRKADTREVAERTRPRYDLLYQRAVARIQELMSGSATHLRAVGTVDLELEEARAQLALARVALLAAEWADEHQPVESSRRWCQACKAFVNVELATAAGVAPKHGTSCPVDTALTALGLPDYESRAAALNSAK